MKIVFISNFFNHHQYYLSEEFNTLTDGEFFFIETENMPEERKRLGYQSFSKPYLLNVNDIGWKRAQELVDEADVVICGSAPEQILKNRKKEAKLIFRYSERPLKKGPFILKYFPRLIKWHYNNPFWKPIYMLCASAYTASDYRKFGLFKKCAYRWGYFPKTEKYEDIRNLILKKKKNEILWCARFIGCKKYEDAILAVELLRKKGYNIELSLIGDGELKKNAVNMVKEKNLEEFIHFKGAMSPEQVRKHMERAGIFLFTSNKEEGWGAVVNEAMNSGCAVVVSDSAGSAPYLIDNNVNGLIFETGNVSMICEKLEFLLTNEEEQGKLGEEAYKTIINEWNAKTAAERFVKIAYSILKGDKHPVLYNSGPGSMER